MQNAIELRGVGKRFGVNQVLKQIDLDVPRRSVFGFLGNNGAGKSTTIRLITGLLQADAGEVRVLERDIRTHRKQVLAAIGCIVDAPTLYPNLTAGEFLRIGCAIKRLPAREIGRVLDVVGLGRTGKTLIAHFSLGMKQRLALAHALLGSPRLLVLDEPGNGLDPHGIREMRTLLRALAEESGCTVFVSSHQLDEIEKVATHVALLKDGMVASQGAIDVLMASHAGILAVDIGDAGQALGVLRALGYDVRKTGDTSIEVHRIERQHADAVHASLVHGGVRLFASAYRQPTLEQWFLQATKQAAAEGATCS